MLRYGLSVLLLVMLGTCGDRGMGPSEEGQIVLSVRYADSGSGKVAEVQRVDRMVVSLTRNGKQVQERELVYSSGSWQGVLKVGAGRYGVVVVAYKGDKVKWRGSTSVRVQAGKRSPAEVVMESTNQVPVLERIRAQQVAEGEGLRLELRGSDADGDGLTYSVAGEPEGSSFSDGVFTWTPTYQQSGTYRVTFSVADQYGGVAEETVVITVGETNREPVLASIGSQRVAEGEGLRVALSATDADGDRLRYSASGRPAGSSFSGGVFSWTPTYEQSGTYRVTFTVSDGQGGTDRETVTIAVGETNREPVLASIGAQRVAEGTSLRVALSATDADGDRLTYSASGRPAGSSFSGGVFSWTPTYQQSGTYRVTFTVSDGQGGTDRETVTIAVGETNREPVLASIGWQRVAEGERLQLVVSATDADGDGLTYSASGRPTGATLSDSVFSWTPSYTQAGMYRVAFSVSDGRGGTDQEAVTIIVSETKPDLVVEGAVNQSRLKVGASFTFSATVKNVGTRAAEATTVRYYRSEDAVIGSNDEVVGTDAVGDLAVAGEREASISLTVPWETGAYYYGACVERVGDELDTRNNCSAGVQVTATAPEGPDLVVETVAVSNNRLVVEASFTLSATVLNQGQASAEATTVRYYRSEDAVIGGDDEELDTGDLGGLASVRRGDVAVRLKAPATAGTYYYGICVDEVAGDNGVNNCSSGVEVRVTGPDLVVSAAGVSRAQIYIGESFGLSATVQNVGEESADATRVRYYRSADRAITTGDTEVGTDGVGRLSARGSAEVETTLRVASAGVYYYGACVERVGGEYARPNNCSAGVQVRVVGRPDVQVEDVAVSRNRVGRGESVRLSAQVVNEGGSVATGTRVVYYRSSDVRITAGDARVGTGSVERLAAGSAESVGVDLTAPTTGGVYYYGLCVSGVSGETATRNNCSSGVALEVSGPDLVVEEVSVSSDRLPVEASFTLSATVKNAGGANASATRVRYYLSADEEIDGADEELEVAVVGGLSSGGVYDGSVRLTAPAGAGVYYYGACVEGVSGEGDTGNNCSEAVVFIAMSSGGPDLVVQWVSVSGGELKSGDSFTLSASVANVGDASSSSATVVRYYVSADSTITGSDREVGRGYIGGLDVGGTWEVEREMTGADWYVYYGVCVDGVSGEEARGNNCSGGVRVEVEPSLGDEWAFSLLGGGEMEFVWIEPGVFQMGSPESEEGRWDDEGPVHEVEISTGFWLGKYEVTQGEWEAVMGETPWSGRDYVRSNRSHPAVYISWHDVQEFIEKLNAAAGSSVYRLPTEAEWEYACRAGAGTSKRWSFGDNASLLGDYAWYDGNNDPWGTKAVGGKLPNRWGLYDMHGNVWEWVQDWYSSSYYNSSPRVDPRGPTSGSERVMRGGAFNNHAHVVRSANRASASPGYRYYYIGVRLVRISTP